MWEATGSDCRSGSGSGSADCSRRCSRRAARRWSRSLSCRGRVGAAVGYAIGGWHESVAGGIGGALGAAVVATLVAGTLGRGGTRGGTAALVGLASLVLAALAFDPVRRLPRGGRAAGGRPLAPAAAGPSATPACAASRATRPAVPKKLILIVIDGLTPEVFEDAVETESAPALAFLARHGSYRRGVSTFPSLTPVCLSSIATGAHPDVHRIPHLVWWHRGERRLVEYGSSFAAVRAAGHARGRSLDAVFNLNEQHLGRDAVTVYEALEDAGLTTAAVNITCYRGRTPHLPVVPGLTRPAYGPKGFFFYSLFESRGDRRAGRRLRPLVRLDRRVRRLRRPLARDARRLRPARLLPARLRLRLARARPGRDARGARAAATPRSAR